MEVKEAATPRGGKGGRGGKGSKGGGGGKSGGGKGNNGYKAGAEDDEGDAHLGGGRGRGGGKGSSGKGGSYQPASNGKGTPRAKPGDEKEMGGVLLVAVEKDGRIKWEPVEEIDSLASREAKRRVERDEARWVKSMEDSVKDARVNEARELQRKERQRKAELFGAEHVYRNTNTRVRGPLVPVPALLTQTREEEAAARKAGMDKSAPRNYQARWRHRRPPTRRLARRRHTTRGVPVYPAAPSEPRLTDRTTFEWGAPPVPLHLCTCAPASMCMRPIRPSLLPCCLPMHAHVHVRACVQFIKESLDALEAQYAAKERAAREAAYERNRRRLRVPGDNEDGDDGSDGSDGGWRVPVPVPVPVPVHVLRRWVARACARARERACRCGRRRGITCDDLHGGHACTRCAMHAQAMICARASPR